MRIRRPKLQMPHPFIIAAFAMVWPLCAALLTIHDTRPDNAAPLLQTVEVHAQKVLLQVASVPALVRAHWHQQTLDG